MSVPLQRLDLTPPGDRSSIEGLEELMADPAATSDEVLRALQALNDSDLMSFGLAAYRMNLLSLFSDRWSQKEIAETARQAAISKIWGGWEYHHHYLPRLTSAPEPPQLGELPAEMIRNLLEKGRGIVVVSFHLGHMRYIPSDLAHAGISTTLPLARDSFNDYETARVGNPTAALWEHLQFVDVEEGSGTLSLARTLSKGGCVFSTIDGNTGRDGPRGGERRTTVRILGASARVKDGLIRMAARFGSPILLMIAHTVDGKRICTTAPIIDPGGPLSGAEAEHFVGRALQDAYSFLGQSLLSRAGEWCGGDLFHQWRVPSPACNREIEVVEKLLMQELEAGMRIAVNTRRIIQLPGEKEIVWTDVMTGRCYKLPLEMEGLIERLSNDTGGVSLEWLNGHDDLVRSRMWGLMCQLASKDAIRRSE